MFQKSIVVLLSLSSFLLPCSSALADVAAPPNAAAPNETAPNPAPQTATPKKVVVKPKKVVKRKIYQMVFSSNRDAPSSEQSLYSMNFDGSDVRRLTDPATDEYAGLDDRCPAVSPDGFRVAFARYVDDVYKYDLFILDTETSKLTRITHDVGTESQPSWSPDGNSIAYAGAPKRDAEGEGITDRTWNCIHILNLDTNKHWQMTAPKNDAYAPAWSFDGDKIAFVGAQNVEDDPLVIYPLMRMDQNMSYGDLQGIGLARFLTRNGRPSVDAVYIAYLDTEGTSVKSFKFIDESKVKRYPCNADTLVPSNGVFDGTGHYRRQVEGRFYSPSWSLDSSTVLYLATKSNDGFANPNLYAQNLQTNEIRDIAPNTPWEADPVMVSNGTSSKLVYVRSNRGNHDLIVGDLGNVAFNAQQITSSPFLGPGRHLVSMEPSCYPLIRKEIVRAETASQ